MTATLTHVHYGLSNMHADVDLYADGHHFTRVHMTLRRRRLTRRWYAPQVSASTSGAVYRYSWRTVPGWLRPTVDAMVAAWAGRDAS